MIWCVWSRSDSLSLLLASGVIGRPAQDLRELLSLTPRTSSASRRSGGCCGVPRSRRAAALARLLAALALLLALGRREEQRSIASTGASVERGPTGLDRLGRSTRSARAARRGARARAWRRSCSARSSASISWRQTVTATAQATRWSDDAGDQRPGGRVERGHAGAQREHEGDQEAGEAGGGADAPHGAATRAGARSSAIGVGAARLHRGRRRRSPAPRDAQLGALALADEARRAARRRAGRCPRSAGPSGPARRRGRRAPARGPAAAPGRSRSRRGRRARAGAARCRGSARRRR